MAKQSPSKALVAQEKLKSILASPSVKSRFDEMLGKRSAGFVSSVLSAVAANPGLSECDPRSIVASAAIAASMDLPISPSLGFAHMVPYKGVATFQMGWKGYVQLAMRSGQYKTINAAVVYEGQIKSHNKFTGEMEFVEQATSDRQLGYLLYFKLLNGYEKYFYMTYEDCEAHGKKYSPSFKKGFGLWAENFDAMALKTVVKLGLSKYGILSLEMQKAIDTDEQTPVSRLVDQLHDDAHNETVQNQLNEIAVDAVQSPELESQETPPEGENLYVETQN